jgi:protein TonB
MNRDTLIALVVALFLHAGFFVGGQWFKAPPAPKPPVTRDEPIPVIELVPLPPGEPAAASIPVESAGAEESAEVATPALNSPLERPSAVVEAPFVQPIQPPPPGLAARGGVIAIPGTRDGRGGVGTDIGQGLANLFNLADLDQPPTPTLRVSPVYPYEMRRAGVSGEVLVGFIVDTAGHVRDAYAVRSSRREFVDEAVRAVRLWTFIPGRRSGVVVNTRMQVPLVFNLQSN